MNNTSQDRPIGSKSTSKKGDQKQGEYKYEVLQEDIAAKQGNFIFTIGNVSSGKSCLQNMIVHRLMKRRDISLDFANQDGDHVHDNILNTWISRIDRGELPTRTDQNYIQEFSIKLTPEKSKDLTIKFLEISGEDIKTILPSSDKEDAPSLNEKLTLYLKADPKLIRKRFIFVADSSRSLPDHDRKNDPAEDILFNTLINHLLSKSVGLKKIQVLFLVAKWDMVQGRYKNARQFTNRHFPQTTRKLKSDRCNVTYFPFSVGDVANDPVANDPDANDPDKDKPRIKRLPRIKRFDAIYTDIVLQWIYQTYTGKSLPNIRKIKKTLLDRLKEWFL